MPVSHIPSSDGKKVTKTSHKRRRDQNSEISELEALLPWSQKGAGIDKISVLRLTSAFMKFRDFWDSSNQSNTGQQNDVVGFDRLFTEAIDGFLIIISASGEILYVSESVADYVGVTQQEVIGQSIYELTHEDDHDSISDNLKAKGIRPRQFRQFYIRFKSSISPGKKQLSRFGGTIMVHVSGNLKISQRRGESQYGVVGLIAECRRIESSCSILEISIPQTMFTSTTTMDLKILSIDTKMSTVTGFDSEIKGTTITDFFHPADNRRSIHCLKMLLITGQATSPIIRFMTHTGEWVWVQIQGLMRYEHDNQTPKYLEANFKLICAGSNGTVKMIEQTELYGKIEDSPEGGIHTDARFDIPSKPKVTGPDSVIKAIEDTDVSPAVRDVLLHGREQALMSIPMNTDRLASWGEVVEAVVEYEVSNGLEPNYNSPFPPPPSLKPTPNNPSIPSPLSSSSSSTTPLSHVPLNPPSEIAVVGSSPESRLHSSPQPPNQYSSMPSGLTDDLSSAFDIYRPSTVAMTTLENLTSQLTAQSPSLNPVANNTSTYSNIPSANMTPSVYSSHPVTNPGMLTYSNDASYSTGMTTGGMYDYTSYNDHVGYNQPLTHANVPTVSPVVNPPPVNVNITINLPGNQVPPPPPPPGNYVQQPVVPLSHYNFVPQGIPMSTYVPLPSSVVIPNSGHMMNHVTQGTTNIDSFMNTGSHPQNHYTHQPYLSNTNGMELNPVKYQLQDSANYVPQTSYMPYNVHGAFEVNQTTGNDKGMLPTTEKDILEVLRLV